MAALANQRFLRPVGFYRYGAPLRGPSGRWSSANKKGVEMGRYYASEAMRNPELQKRAIDWTIKKGKPVLRKVDSEMLNQLSTKVRPNIRFKTDRPELDGRGLPVVPFPMNNFNKLWRAVSNKKTGSGFSDFFEPRFVSQGVLVPKFATNPKLLKASSKAVPNHHRYTDVLKKTIKNYYGSGVDVHALIVKLPKPKKSWTLPGHNYTGPYSPLDKQLDYDPETGEIFQIHRNPTGATDAVAMQYDIDYSSCGHWAI